MEPFTKVKYAIRFVFISCPHKVTLSNTFEVINDDDSASRNSIQTADGALCLGVEEDNRYVFYFYVAYKNTLTHVLKHKHIINLDFF